MIRLVLFTRYPHAGAAKTRLIPALGGAGAALVHKRLTQRTVALLPGAEIHFTGAPKADFVKWLGDGFTYIAQPPGDLTDRLLAALEPAPVIFFGADTPDLDARHVSAAIAALTVSDVVIGPAEDGGYYLIGVAKPLPDLFTNMPWSTDQVLPQTLARLRQMGIKPVILETLSDCDRPEDVVRWPSLTA